MGPHLSGHVGHDPSYHDRHTRRTLGRARAIERSLTGSNCPSKSLLDVGCNRGITSSYLLDVGAVDEVVGVELERETVMPSLQADHRFTMMQGDITVLPLLQSFDVVVYGAVHHHVFRNYGLGTAVRVLQKLVDQARYALFFETGHITEGGRWGWQKSIRRYFRTDEEHLFYLAKSIEPRLSGFSIVGRFWIHGSRRWLIRFDLTAPSKSNHLTSKLGPIVSKQAYIRAFGSSKQALLAKTSHLHDSPTEFFVQNDQGKDVFRKSYLHHLGSAEQEYDIGRKVVHPWAVSAKSIQPDRTLIFPFVEGSPIHALNGLAQAERDSIASQLLRIWKEASKTRISAKESLLLPRKDQARLLDVIDINRGNVIVDKIGGAPVVKVIDFEPHSNHNRWRNRLHFAGMMFFLRRSRRWASLMLIQGYWQGLGHCIAYQFKSAETRIADRQPSLISVIVANLRSMTGAVVGNFRPFKER